jgi:hypothetical protein
MDNSGKEKCVFAIDKIYEGSILGVPANTRYASTTPKRGLRLAA